MTTTQSESLDFIAYLQSIGLSIRANGSTLLISPSGGLRGDDAAFIRANKAELLDLVAEREFDGGNFIMPPFKLPTTEPEADKSAPQVPPGAVIVRADKDMRTDAAMRSPAHMWTWIDAGTWYYVRDYPAPNFEKSEK